MTEHHRTLGISAGASQEEVKRAFRALAHRHHPDKPGGDAERFKRINTAYQEVMKGFQGSPAAGFTIDSTYDWGHLARKMKDQQEETERRRRAYMADILRQQSGNVVFYNGKWHFKI